MDIFVAIKQVPDTDKVKMDPATGTMVREGVDAIVNPLDLYAIELAIRLKEKHGGRVTAFTMGPPAAEKALKEAMAMGCDAGVLVTDRAFSGSDTWATSYALSLAVAKMGRFDLILAGERATDGDTGQVGPCLAAWLGIPVLSYAGSVEAITAAAADSESVAGSAGRSDAGSAADTAGSAVGGGRMPGAGDVPGTRHITGAGMKVRARRLVEEGYQLVEAEMPCLLTVVKEVATPRLPTLRGKKYARATPVAVYGAADLDADPARLGLKGSPTKVSKIFYPKVTRDGKTLRARDDAEIEAAVDELVAFLEEKDLIGGLGA